MTTTTGAPLTKEFAARIVLVTKPLVFSCLEVVITPDGKTTSKTNSDANYVEPINRHSRHDIFRVRHFIGISDARTLLEFFESIGSFPCLRVSSGPASRFDVNSEPTRESVRVSVLRPERRVLH